MKKPVVAVLIPQLGLLLYQECGLDQAAAARLAPAARLLPALELHTEPVAGNHGLLIEAVYAPEQAGLVYPAGVTHQVREVYQVNGAYLVVESADMEVYRVRQ